MRELHELYQAYSKDVWQWFYWKCGNHDIAMDLMQDTFVQVLRSLSTFQNKSSERTWIFGIAKHIWLNYLRKHMETLELNEDMVIHNIEDFQAQVVMLLDCLKEKDERSYIVFQMRLEGYSFDEIATTLACSSSSIRVLYHRAKLWLRTEMKVKE